MGHYINGFIARDVDLIAAANQIPNAVVCRLPLGFAFLPFVDSFLDPTEAAFESESLDRLTMPKAAWAQGHSTSFPIAYIETEYFGGVGSQSSVIWTAGEISFGPIRSGEGPADDGAINRAVRQLGVMRGNAIDEFAALGLGRYRSNEDWVEAAASLLNNPTLQRTGAALGVPVKSKWLGAAPVWPLIGPTLFRQSKTKAEIVHQEKWPSPLPESGSAKDRSLRLVTGIVMVPFGAFWISLMAFDAVDAVREGDVCALLAILVGASWFGFITWSAVTYAFAGYYPLAFIRLWNATWGWVGKRMPIPPSDPRK
jgi:hypothetical protein